MAVDLRIRSVRAGDCELLWRWANDPIVRAAAFSTDPIPLASHERWFADRLADPNTMLLVAESPGGQPVGQIRFDLRPGGQDADVDVTVDSALRGQGVGARLIADGVLTLRAQYPACVIRALVRPGNVASRTAFERAGFVFAGETTHAGIEVYMFLDHPVVSRT